MYIPLNSTSIGRSVPSSLTKCFAEKDAGVNNNTDFTDSWPSILKMNAEESSPIGSDSLPVASAFAMIYLTILYFTKLTEEKEGYNHGLNFNENLLFILRIKAQIQVPTSSFISCEWLFVACVVKLSCFCYPSKFRSIDFPKKTGFSITVFCVFLTILLLLSSRWS